MVEIGDRFGRLTVTGLGIDAGFSNQERGVLVECRCGATRVVRTGNLVHGGTRSCGCLRKETLRAKQVTEPALPSEVNGARPTTAAVLGILAEAGESGVLAADLARSFGTPAKRNARNRAVNAILTQSMHSGRATRSEVPESSPYYNHVPCFRWFITDQGRANPGRAPRGETSRRTALARKQLARERRDAALARVKDQGLGPHTPLDTRDQAVRELCAAGVSSNEIGATFSISGARVRQIRAETPVPHCVTCTCSE
jgi:ATP/maltotriose-dependent transcriptional regulator MalT